MNGMFIELVVVAAVLGIGCSTELKSRRIPNWLTAGGMATGLVLGLMPGGLTFLSSALGLGVGFGALFLFYLFGGIGGGDVKMMGAVGALMGFPAIIPILLVSALAGGLMAALLVTWTFVRSKDRSEKTRARSSIPFGLAIAAATLLTIYGAVG
jgi:prepilin peptidase CpaA